MVGFAPTDDDRLARFNAQMRRKGMGFYQRNKLISSYEGDNGDTWVYLLESGRYLAWLKEPVKRGYSRWEQHVFPGTAEGLASAKAKAIQMAGRGVTIIKDQAS